MTGIAVFHGTRVPVQTLLDDLEGGETIDDFLEGFPSVTREQVIAFLEEAKAWVIEAASLRVFLDECVDWASMHVTYPPHEGKLGGRRIGRFDWRARV